MISTDLNNIYFGSIERIDKTIDNTRFTLSLKINNLLQSSIYLPTLRQIFNLYLLILLIIFLLNVAVQHPIVRHEYKTEMRNEFGISSSFNNG